MSHTVIGQQGAANCFYMQPSHRRSRLTVVALEELDTRLPIWRFSSPRGHTRYCSQKSHLPPKASPPTHTHTDDNTKTAQSHLGGEVSVEDAFAVQVLQPAGNIKRQTDPDAPRQVEVAVQQLLQIPSVDVLQTHGETSSVVGGARNFNTY